MNPFQNKPYSLWGWLLVGILFTFDSLYTLIAIKGGFEWRGVYIPVWTRVLLLPVGLYVLVFSIYGLITGKGKPKPKTLVELEEESAKAEAEMDAMYQREHGKPPEKPKKIYSALPERSRPACGRLLDGNLSGEKRSDSLTD